MTFRTDRLEAALKAGYFFIPLEDKTNMILQDSIVTAIKIKDCIDLAPEKGVTLSEIAALLNLKERSIAPYCQWLFENGLIDRTRTQGIEPWKLIYFKKPDISRFSSKDFLRLNDKLLLELVNEALAECVRRNIMSSATRRSHQK